MSAPTVDERRAVYRELRCLKRRMMRARRQLFRLDPTCPVAIALVERNRLDAIARQAASVRLTTIYAAQRRSTRP